MAGATNDLGRTIRSAADRRAFPARRRHGHPAPRRSGPVGGPPRRTSGSRHRRRRSSACRGQASRSSACRGPASRHPASRPPARSVGQSPVISGTLGAWTIGRAGAHTRAGAGVSAGTGTGARAGAGAETTAAMPDPSRTASPQIPAMGAPDDLTVRRIQCRLPRLRFTWNTARRGPRTLGRARRGAPAARAARPSKHQHPRTPQSADTGVRDPAAPHGAATHAPPPPCRPAIVASRLRARAAAPSTGMPGARLRTGARTADPS